MKKASQIRIGDLIDLQGDPIADAGPHPADKAKAGTATDYDTHRLAFECELQPVAGIERETPDCIRIDFYGFSIGFPVDHLLRVES